MMSQAIIHTSLASNGTTGTTDPANELLLQEATPEQREAIRELLSANKLPVNDLTEAVKLYALTFQGAVLGSAGLEVYGTKGLLRSVSIADGAKGRGWGKLISQTMEVLARQQGIDQLYLITITAEGFYSKLGYRKITRDEVPASLRQSWQFNATCPASATVMMKDL